MLRRKLAPWAQVAIIGAGQVAKERAAAGTTPVLLLDSGDLEERNQGESRQG